MRPASSAPLGGLAMLLAVTLAALVGAACGDLTYDEVAPGVVPERPAYETDIAPILARVCTRCHGSSSGPGYEPILDNLDDARDHACLSLEEMNDGYMPPGAMETMDARERLTFERWVVNTLGQTGCEDDDDDDDDRDDEDDD